jgi:hypothetical protein
MISKKIIDSFKMSGQANIVLPNVLENKQSKKKNPRSKSASSKSKNVQNPPAQNVINGSPIANIDVPRLQPQGQGNPAPIIPFGQDDEEGRVVKSNQPKQLNQGLFIPDNDIEIVSRSLLSSFDE